MYIHITNSISLSLYIYMEYCIDKALMLRVSYQVLIYNTYVILS